VAKHAAAGGAPLARWERGCGVEAEICEAGPRKVGYWHGLERERNEGEGGAQASQQLLAAYSAHRGLCIFPLCAADYKSSCPCSLAAHKERLSLTVSCGWRVRACVCACVCVRVCASMY